MVWACGKEKCGICAAIKRMEESELENDAAPSVQTFLQKYLTEGLDYKVLMDQETGERIDVDDQGVIVQPDVDIEVDQAAEERRRWEAWQKKSGRQNWRE